MSSRFELFHEPKVATTVSAPNGASELYLIDRSFNEVARGVGKLEIPVVPGLYRVRERVGDTESVSEVLTVAVDANANFIMDGVAYESALPLPGTATYQKMPSQQQPQRNGPGVRIVVRDPNGCKRDSGIAESCLMKEVERLRIETLLGEQVGKLTGATEQNIEDGVFVADIDLVPGSYALVQEGADGRQSCMALYVMPDWYPSIYLMLPARPYADSGGRPARLSEASLFYEARQALAHTDDIELARLEAARHALSRGRPIGGWSLLPNAQGDPVVNPLMALIDAYLLLPGKPDTGDDSVSALIAGATAGFGEGFPDVQALHMARRRALQAQQSRTAPEDGQDVAPAQPDKPALDSLAGPPILSRSWRHLLDACNAQDKPALALPFEFSVEPSESWFIWSENVGARSRSLNELASVSRSDAGKGAELITLAKELFERIAASDKAREWVMRVQQVAGEQMARGNRLFADPAMQRIVASLVMVSDPILQKAFRESGSSLVEHAWSTLQLPNDVIQLTMRRFLSFLVTKKLLAGLIMVAGISIVVAVAKWLRWADRDDTRA